MTTRNNFLPEEWQAIRQTPFWLWQMLCSETVPAVSKHSADALLAEMNEPRFFPPLVRAAFRSALTETPAPFTVFPPADTFLQAFRALQLRAAPDEAAHFQMSLAFLGRMLVKRYGSHLASSRLNIPIAQAQHLRLEQIWHVLGFGNFETGLRRDEFSADEWHQLQLAAMQIWMMTSLVEKPISAEETAVLKSFEPRMFPPAMYFVLTGTAGNLDELYGTAKAGFADALKNIAAVSDFVEARLSPESAVIYKMSLLMLARDVIDINTPPADNSQPKPDEKYVKAFHKISDALKLNLPPRKIINQTSSTPEVQTRIEPSKERIFMTNSEPQTPETVADAIARMETAAQNEIETPMPQQNVVVPQVSPNFTEQTEQPPQMVEAIPAETISEAAELASETEAAQVEGNAAMLNESAEAAESVESVETLTETVAETPSQTVPEVAPVPRIQIPEIDEAELEREIEGTIPTALKSFADYKKTINVVAGDLRELMQTADELKMQNSSGLVQDMLKRVEENSFSIAVVGEFKRGKSTFINALLGKDILPSDILPCSATLNRVTYGVRPGVLVKFKDGTEESVDINKLTEYVTKLTEESEEMAGRVKEAIVSYPIPYCQNNVEIIDTPGLNDDATMTDVTLSVLPHVDAAILVIMAQSPFSEYERAFLEDKLLTSDLGRVIFIVTAIDRLNRPEDADRVVKAIRDRIRKYVIKRAAEQFGAESEEYEVYIRKIGEPRVFPLSAWQALQAKEKADNALLVTSRFDVFENALEKFLSEERGAIFLQVPINRLLSASAEVLSTFKIREGALQMQQGDFNAASEIALRDIEDLRQRKNSEMQRVDAAAKQVEIEVKPLVGQLDEAIKSTALDVIENAEIEEADVANQEAIKKLVERLNTQIQAAVQTSTQKQLEKIQLVVQRGVTAEAMRWTDFSDSMNVVTRGIEGRFTGESLDIQDTTLTQGVGIVATILGFGGAYTGYKVAGWKGAAVGAGASIGVGIGTVLAIGLVAGTVLALPVLILGTVAALPAGAWLARKVFGGDQVTKFRENFKNKMMENLEQQITASSVEHKIIAEIDKAFGDLKKKIHSEVEATLNDTEKTLNELRLKRERDEIVGDHERLQLFKMRRETLKIKKRAEKLNDLLLQVSEAS